MSLLTERLRTALSPRYRLDREIGAGGMARVFLAADTTLDRRVAVKVLRPELATAIGSERFLREARSLAAVSHPNVVAIHECSAHDGILFYVMDFVDAPTLRQRLADGALPPDRAFDLASNLLEALAATHTGGVIHRDVKPGNIFLCHDRALLTDFGIAKDLFELDAPLTEAESPGTPAYMAPEQASDGTSSERSDLYSAAMVIYEAFTGRRWQRFQLRGRTDWSGVPRRLRPVLARALDPEPERRWPDAPTFRNEIAGTRGVGAKGLQIAVILLAALSVFLVWWAWPKPLPPVTSDLAVLPCSAPGIDPAAESFVRAYAITELDDLRDVDVLSDRQTRNNWERLRDRLSDDNWAGWSTALGSTWVTECRITPSEDQWRIRVELHDGSRSRGPFYRVAGRDSTIAAGEALFHALLLGLGDVGLTDVSPAEAGVLSLYSPEPTLLFLEGKEKFREDALLDATSLFAQALEMEPDFALAEWHLAESQRWLAHAAVTVDLEELYRSRASRLPPRDSMLLAARVAPYEQKPSRLEAVATRYADEAYPTLIYADELYHRGGLWGEPLDSAVALLEAAVRKDSSLAPAVEHLVQAQIRLGQRDAALRNLEHLESISGIPDQHYVYYPYIWGQGWAERFADAAEAEAGLRDLIDGFGREGSSEQVRSLLEFLRIGSRWVRYVELPASQSMLGAQLLEVARSMRLPDDVATGFLAIALGEIGQGHILAGIAALDSLASESGSGEGSLQAAEWRVLPHSLGLAGFDFEAAAEGAGMLETLLADTATSQVQRRRAGFALAMFVEANSQAGALGIERSDFRAEFATANVGEPNWDAASVLEGVALAAAGRPTEALEATVHLVAYDSVALASYPFSRSTVYWLRAGWQAEAGDTTAALRSLYWHENTDLEEGTPPGIAQAAEVDAAFGVHARARAVELAANLGEGAPTAGLPTKALVCSRGLDLLRLWATPDSALLPIRAAVASEVSADRWVCAP